MRSRSPMGRTGGYIFITNTQCKAAVKQIDFTTVVARKCRY